MNYLRKILLLLDKKVKQRLIWLVFLSVFLSVVEVVGISAIMPFVDIAINFENIYNNQYYHELYTFFQFKSEVDFAIAFGLALFGFYLFRAGINLYHGYSIAKFSEGLYAQVTQKLFRQYLNMPYQEFTRKNSSYLTKAIVTEALNISIIIGSILVMLSEIFVLIFLYALMLLADHQITLIFTVILSIKMLFLTKTVSKKIENSGKVRAEVQADYYEIVNRVLGNFEQIKLHNESEKQDIFSDFSTKVERYANANSIYNFLQHIPRLFVETVGFSLIIFLLIVLLYSSQTNVASVLPTLTLFVLALYRLLPSVNRIVVGYNTLIYFHKAIDIVGEELKIQQEDLLDKLVPFTREIRFEKVSFLYKEKPILRCVDLVISKGDKVAFIGESGSGKTTLVNLITGLYSPTEGRILIDEMLLNESNFQDWRSKVGYISQHTYLFDGTIAENVFFGRERDEHLLEKSLKQANIFDFLQTKEGADTLVGEGGIQLSGGQKQRIAIARALYGEPEILILDEATSALDDDTESKVMEEIYQISQSKTLIIIAHRLSTIKDCDKVYSVKDGVLLLENSKLV